MPSARAFARSRCRSPLTVLAPLKPKMRCDMRPTRGADVAAMAPSKHLHPQQQYAGLPTPTAAGCTSLAPQPSGHQPARPDTQATDCTRATVYHHSACTHTMPGVRTASAPVKSIDQCALLLRYDLRKDGVVGTWCRPGGCQGKHQDGHSIPGHRAGLPIQRQYLRSSNSTATEALLGANSPWLVSCPRVTAR